MPFAIGNDGKGLRRIDGPDDVLPGEYFSETEERTPILTREDIEESRLRAYADPLTGSDRYFAEAARIQAMGGAANEAELARAAGATRSAEIQALYPWPA